MSAVVESSKEAATVRAGQAEHVAAHRSAASAPRAGRWGRFLWHAAEMVLAMMAGMAVYGGVRTLLNPSGLGDLHRA